MDGNCPFIRKQLILLWAYDLCADQEKVKSSNNVAAEELRREPEA